jgi:hypothetical protein
VLHCATGMANGRICWAHLHDVEHAACWAVVVHVVVRNNQEQQSPTKQLVWLSEPAACCVVHVFCSGLGAAVMGTALVASLTQSRRWCGQPRGTVLDWLYIHCTAGTVLDWLYIHCTFYCRPYMLLSILMLAGTLLKSNMSFFLSHSAGCREARCPRG